MTMMDYDIQIYMQKILKIYIVIVHQYNSLDLFTWCVTIKYIGFHIAKFALEYNFTNHNIMGRNLLPNLKICFKMILY